MLRSNQIAGSGVRLIFVGIALASIVLLSLIIFSGYIVWKYRNGGFEKGSGKGGGHHQKSNKSPNKTSTRGKGKSKTLKGSYAAKCQKSSKKSAAASAKSSKKSQKAAGKKN